jgi:hypothetical protein
MLKRFLLGFIDYNARVHLELHRDPATIDDAVQCFLGQLVKGEVACLTV